MVSVKHISVVATVSSVHDDRVLIEERIDRELFERVLPLVHPHRLPMSVEAGPSLDALRPLPVPSPWGPPWGTTWFRCRADVPAEWAARRVEAIIDLGFAADSPGFPVRGPRAWAARRTAPGHPPAAHGRSGRRRRRPRRDRHRGGVEPDVPAVPAVPARFAGDRRRVAAVRVHPRRPRRRRRGGGGAAPRLHTSSTA